MSRAILEGTWSVLIPVEHAGEENEKFVKEHIDPKDLCQDKIVNKGRNIELDPHITCHNGLSFDEEKLRNCLKDIKPFHIYVRGLGRFTNPPTVFAEDQKEHSYDVLWRHIIDPTGNLARIHQSLVVEFNKAWRFPEYNPHLTLAYLEYQKADKYVNDKSLEIPLELRVDTIIYKKFGEDERIIIKLGEEKNV
jgi:2'-5' RNA ligase